MPRGLPGDNCEGRALPGARGCQAAPRSHSPHIGGASGDVVAVHSRMTADAPRAGKAGSTSAVLADPGIREEG